MKRTSRPILLTLLLAVSLTACGGNTETSTPIPAATATSPAATNPTVAPTTGTGSTSNPTVAPTIGSTGAPTPTTGSGSPPVTSGSGASVIRVVVTGGPHAGTYDRNSDRATCSAGLTGNGSWGNQYSDTSIDSGLSSLQLIVPNTQEAKSGTSHFLATFTFGKLFADNSTEYTIDGQEGKTPQGAGTVKITDDTNSATVNIQAEPESGVKIDATIHCNQVVAMDAGNGEPTKSADTAATIHVTLEGGAQPGTFDLTSTDEVCGYGPNTDSVLSEGLDDRSDAWTVEYRSGDENDKIFAFELMVPKTKDASGGTNVFYLSVNDQQYYYENLEGNGTDSNGKVTVQNNGATGNVTVDAQTVDGLKIKATVDCKRVTR